MTAPQLEAVRGRPVTTIAGLQAALARSRERNTELRIEIQAHLREDREFAERVRIGVDRISAAATAGSRMAVVNEAGKLGYLADRRIRQIGPVAL